MNAEAWVALIGVVVSVGMAIGVGVAGVMWKQLAALGHDVGEIKALVQEREDKLEEKWERREDKLMRRIDKLVDEVKTLDREFRAELAAVKHQ